MQNCENEKPTTCMQKKSNSNPCPFCEFRHEKLVLMVWRFRKRQTEEEQKVAEQEKKQKEWNEQWEVCSIHIQTLGVGIFSANCYMSLGYNFFACLSIVDAVQKS